MNLTPLSRRTTVAIQDLKGVFAMHFETLKLAYFYNTGNKRRHFGTRNQGDDGLHRDVFSEGGIHTLCTAL
jgi:hypothetical protein